MKKQKDRLKNSLSFWCVLYPVAIFVGLAILPLRLIGWIKVRGYENLLRCKGPVLLASNHPSLWEPIILAGLFFPQYVFHPTKRIPWSTPDQNNYTDTWYWGLLKSRFISVPRGNHRGELLAIDELVEKLDEGYSSVLFVEGGRTIKGKGDDFDHSCSGKRMRKLKNGVGRIVCRTNCTVVTAWVDGAEQVLPIGTWFPRVWRGMTITFGEPSYHERMENPRKPDFEEATNFIAKALLKTAG